MYGIIVYDKIGEEKNRSYINWYIEKFAKRGIELRLLFDYEIDENISADFAIVRTINPSLTKFIEGKGIRCFNSSLVSEITNDKALCYKYVEERGIEILPTYYSALEVEDYPVVIKPKNSHGGDRVNLVESKKEMEEILHLYPGDNYVIQAVAEEVGKDLRVYLIGGEIITAILRKSKSGLRSNFSLGGSGQVYSLSDKEKALVYKINSLFNGDFIGIDFVFNKSGIVFNEIEDVVGSRMVYTYTDIDIVELYVDYICRKVKTM